ncbi:hypothetical protein NMY22_g16893 [Coprinellus aureogranulatus]|nr:hypothetical protein NMY22_g16893 [Coprinellus aureogranulatus]
MERKAELRKKEKERRKLGLVGKKKRKERGIWKFDQKVVQYLQLLPLHHLWMGYMSELLGLPAPPTGSIRPGSIGSNVPSSSSMHPKLLKADFHGAVLTVKDSKNPSLVGLSGILIHETENAFKLVTSKNKVKLVPKENSIFTFAVPAYSTLPSTFQPGMPYPLPGSQKEEEPPNPFVPASAQIVLDVPHLVFELYGNQFRFRSSERAGRKFKHKETIELWCIVNATVLVTLKLSSALYIRRWCFDTRVAPAWTSQYGPPLHPHTLSRLAWYTSHTKDIGSRPDDFTLAQGHLTIGCTGGPAAQPYRREVAKRSGWEDRGINVPLWMYPSSTARSRGLSAPSTYRITLGIGINR